MKNKHLSLVGIATFTLSLIAGTVGIQQIEAKAENTFIPSEWTTVGASNVYTVNENSIVANGNIGMRMNYLVKDDVNAIGDYSVSINAQGTMGFPNTKTVHIGIVPWFIDASNYLLAYIDWDPLENPSGIRQLQITGVINGKIAPYVYRGSSFVASTWNDVWMVNEYETYWTPENVLNSFKVTKTLAEAGDADLFTLSLNNVDLGYVIFRDTIKYANKQAKVGIYAYNDSVTFSEFSVASLNNNSTYSVINNQTTGKSQNNVWSYESVGGSYSLNSIGTTDWKQNMLFVPNVNKSSAGYEYKAEIDTMAHDTVYGYGILGWYQDEYNYVMGVIKIDGEQVQVGFVGQYTTAEEVSIIKNEINSLENFSAVSAGLIESIYVYKHSYTIELYINDTKVTEFSNPKIISNGDVGLSVFGANTTFFELQNISAAYIPYDWHQRALGGKLTYISANTNNVNAIRSPSGYYNFLAASVADGDLSKITSLYYATNIYENLSFSLTTATDVLAGSLFGVYAWIEDPDNYFRVILSEQGIMAEYRFGEYQNTRQYNLPSGFTYACLETETRTLKVSISQGIATIEVGMNSDTLIMIADDFEFFGRNLNNFANVGIVAAGKPIGFAPPAIVGYTPYDEILIGDWHTYGPRPSTWNLVDEDTFITSQEGGSTYMQERALKSNFGVQDFYTGATFTISNTTGSEQKAALYPYFKDFNNYLVVMLSKWTVNPSGGIVITGKINGQVLGGKEWHDYSASTTVNFDVVNKLESQIVGDVVNVYLNGSTAPTVSLTMEGLSNRDLTQQYSGFFFFNCDLVIDDFSVSSQERIYTFDEKPVINVYGSVPTTGVVGEEIRLPIFSAENSIGDVLTPVIETTDPNGAEVTLNRNSFVPQMTGTYIVTVNCEDSWGNEADPLTFNILVSEPEPETEPETEPELPWQTIIVLSIFGAIAAGGITIIIIFTVKKKRMK